MTITLATRDDLVAKLRESHRLPSSAVVDIRDQPLLAAIIRRVAEIVAPCSAAMLASQVCASLAPLLSEMDGFRDHVETTIDASIASGDLIELSHVRIPGLDERPGQLYIAPPTFVERKTGRVYVFGVASDDVGVLPASLAARVKYVRALRFIDPEPGEELSKTLRSLGLRQQVESFWIQTPTSIELPEKFITSMQARLGREPTNGDLPGLEILVPHVGGTRYTDRKQGPTDQTGVFVGRRPQGYGAPLWGLVKLNAGAATHFLQFPFPDSRQRGCDVAWRTQLALDALAGTPVTVAVSTSAGGRVFRLSFPIPLWAQRHLSILGAESERDFNPFEFWIPEAEYQAVTEYLRNYLWLSVLESKT